MVNEVTGVIYNLPIATSRESGQVFLHLVPELRSPPPLRQDHERLVSEVYGTVSDLQQALTHCRTLRGYCTEGSIGHQQFPLQIYHRAVSGGRVPGGCYGKHHPRQSEGAKDPQCLRNSIQPLQVRGAVHLIRMGRIHQHDTFEVIWKASGVQLHQQASERMADENIRWFYISRLQEHSQLLHHRLSSPRGAGGLTPAIARPIVCAYAR